MPITPFHVGPAVVVKAFLPGWFSLGVFAVVQVVIDLETGWNIVRGNWPLHGPMHTLIGSLAVAAVAVAPARALLSRLYAALERGLARSGTAPRWLAAQLGPIPWRAAVLGALVGGVSHVLMDAVIHPDVRPLAPWVEGNRLFVPGSFGLMHLACTVSAVVGLLLWLGAARR